MKSFFAVLAVVGLSITLAYAQNLAIPNGDAYTRPGSGITCQYLNRVGCSATGALNAFGTDLAASGWTKALCNKDSDNDGFTNGQELGDPCCLWTAGKPTKLRTTQLSHPGLATSTNSAKKASCKPQTCGDMLSSSYHLKCGRVAIEKFTVAGAPVVVKVSLKKGTMKYKVKVKGNAFRLIGENVRYATSANTRNMRKSASEVFITKFGGVKKNFKESSKIPVTKLRVAPGKTDCCGKDAIVFKVTLKICKKYVGDDCQGGKETITKQFSGKIKCGPICQGPGTPVPMSLTQKCPECITA